MNNVNFEILYNVINEYKHNSNDFIKTSILIDVYKCLNKEYIINDYKNLKESINKIKKQFKYKLNILINSDYKQSNIFNSDLMLQYRFKINFLNSLYIKKNNLHISKKFFKFE
jgi:hypothetical protein